MASGADLGHGGLGGDCRRQPKPRTEHLFLIVGLIEIWQGEERGRLSDSAKKASQATAQNRRRSKAAARARKKCDKTPKNIIDAKANIEAPEMSCPNRVKLINPRKVKQTKKDEIKQQSRQLQDLQDWCMDRISQLSLHHSIDDATALTAEHLELLKSIDPAETLWIGNNHPTDSNCNTHN